jgi:hypothetical protein
MPFGMALVYLPEWGPFIGSFCKLLRHFSVWIASWSKNFTPQNSSNSWWNVSNNTCVYHQIYRRWFRQTKRRPIFSLQFSPALKCASWLWLLIHLWASGDLQPGCEWWAARNSCACGRGLGVYPENASKMVQLKDCSCKIPMFFFPMSCFYNLQ